MSQKISIVPWAFWLVLASTSPATEQPQLAQDATNPVHATAPGQPLPSGEQVIQQMLGRSAAVAVATNAPTWAYDKAQVTFKLDGDAKVEERTEKLYRVRIIQGVPFSRLVKVQGRELKESEIEKENQREAAFEKGFSGRDPKKAVAKHEAMITKDMMDRFEFNVLRREAVNGRQTVVVSFQGSPSKGSSIQDRLLSRLAGTLWLDEETADVARLEVHLTEAFSLGLLGVLGTIRDCHMELESKPMTDGTWLPEKTVLSLSGRMFLSSMRFKMEETSANFTLESPAKNIRP